MSYGPHNIQVLTLLEAVRKRPGMYFGNTTTPDAAEHIVRELVSNVIDLFLSNLATRVYVSLAGGQIEVSDDGPGFDFEKTDDDLPMVEALFTKLHHTASRFGHAPHVHMHALHGVGLAVVNAACESLECRSWRGGKVWTQHFSKGVPLGEARCEYATRTDQGTSIKIKLDPTLLDVVEPRASRLRRELMHMVHLFPGFEVWFEKERFVSQRGLVDLLSLYDLSTSPNTYQWGARPEFELHHKDSHMILQASATGFSDKATEWRTWFNGGATSQGGVHQKAFERALAQVGWKPSCAMLHLISADARFAGPCRDELAEIPWEAEVEQCLLNALRAYDTKHNVSEEGAKNS